MTIKTGFYATCRRVVQYKITDVSEKLSAVMFKIDGNLTLISLSFEIQYCQHALYTIPLTQDCRSVHSEFSVFI